jgi:hypothetical protein
MAHYAAGVDSAGELFADHVPDLVTLTGPVVRPRPQVARDSTGAQMGLGWLLNEPKDVCGHAGGGPGAASSLIIRKSTGQPSVALANRLVPIEPVNARLVRPIA